MARAVRAALTDAGVGAAAVRRRPAGRLSRGGRPSGCCRPGPTACWPRWPTSTRRSRCSPRCATTRPPGSWELVPAARTVLVRFDPALTSADALAADLARPTAAAAPATADGPGRRGAGLLRRRRPRRGGPALRARRRPRSSAATRPRRGRWRSRASRRASATCPAGTPPSTSPGGPSRAPPSPRARSGWPAGSAAIYPRASPGGWQLIGRTGLPLWDLRRADPALLAPGDAGAVRRRGPGRARGPTPAPDAGATRPPVGAPALEVLAPGPLTVVADLGRPGRAAQGVARSGAVDRGVAAPGQPARRQPVRQPRRSRSRRAGCGSGR